MQQQPQPPPASMTNTTVGRGSLGSGAARRDSSVGGGGGGVGRDSSIASASLPVPSDVGPSREGSGLELSSILGGSGGNWGARPSSIR